MRERVRDAFDQITADEKLKEQTKAFLAQKRAPVRRPVRRMAAVLVCVMCLMLGVGGWAYLTPTSAISIESDAALELSVNRFDRVVGVQGTDPAGCALAQTLQVDHMPYLNALQVVLDAQQGQGVSIGVAGDDPARCETMLQAVQDSTTANGQVQCYMTDTETLEQARESELPLGKYRMLLTLQELDPALTADDVRGLSMNEMRQMEEALSGNDVTGQGNGSGNGPGNGANAQNQTGTGQNGSQNGQNGQYGTGNGMGNGMGSGQGSGAGRGQHAG